MLLLLLCDFLFFRLSRADGGVAATKVVVVGATSGSEDLLGLKSFPAEKGIGLPMGIVVVVKTVGCC